MPSPSCTITQHLSSKRRQNLVLSKARTVVSPPSRLVNGWAGLLHTLSIHGVLPYEGLQMRSFPLVDGHRQHDSRISSRLED